MIGFNQVMVNAFYLGLMAELRERMWSESIIAESFSFSEGIDSHGLGLKTQHIFYRADYLYLPSDKDLDIENKYLLSVDVSIDCPIYKKNNNSEYVELVNHMSRFAREDDGYYYQMFEDGVIIFSERKEYWNEPKGKHGLPTFSREEFFNFFSGIISKTEDMIGDMSGRVMSRHLKVKDKIRGCKRRIATMKKKGHDYCELEKKLQALELEKSNLEIMRDPNLYKEYNLKNGMIGRFK